MTPRVLVVEHQRTCPPALLGDWLEEAWCALDVVRPYLGEDLPRVGDPGAETVHHAVVVLGGEMSANDDETVPWLGPVKALVRDAVAAQVPLLGICLGHQLAAVALGGQVTKNPRGQSVGLQDVGWTGEAGTDPLFGALPDLPDLAVHWNGDVVVEPPPGAVALAHGPGPDLQVARFAPYAWGVQAHPEADADVVRAWAESDREDHVALGIDQDAALVAIDRARGRLDRAWRPVAQRFSQLAASQGGRPLERVRATTEG